MPEVLWCLVLEAVNDVSPEDREEFERTDPLALDNGYPSGVQVIHLLSRTCGGQEEALGFRVMVDHKVALRGVRVPAQATVHPGMVRKLGCEMA